MIKKILKEIAILILLIVAIGLVFVYFSMIIILLM